MMIAKPVLNSKGMTLVELLIVMVIITIVTAIAAIGPGFISTERIKSTSRELLADLQYLRQSAMTQGPDNTATALRGFGVRFESANSYHLFRFNDGNSNFIYDDISEEAALPGGSAPRKKYIPVQLKLRIKSGNWLEDPRDKVMIFDHHGIPREKQMGFQLMSIVIENPDLSDAPKKCVSISFNRIREGAWDDQDCREQ